MPTYDPSGSSLLSDDAAALVMADFDELSDLAEDLLGIAGISFTGDDAAALTRAVALEVNLLVASPADAAYLASEAKGSQSRSYRQGGALVVDPRAARIVQRITGGAGDRNAGGAVTAKFRSQYPVSP